MTSDLKASMEFFLPSPPYYNEAPDLRRRNSIIKINMCTHLNKCEFVYMNVNVCDVFHVLRDCNQSSVREEFVPVHGWCSAGQA